MRFPDDSALAAHQEALFGSLPPEKAAKAREARRRGNAAQEAAERAADPLWLAEAEKALLMLARSCQTVTTDEIWEELDRRGLRRPREPRALGPVMKRGASAGWIEPTDRYTPSIQPQGHGRPMRIWRSKLHLPRD